MDPESSRSQEPRNQRPQGPRRTARRHAGGARGGRAATRRARSGGDLVGDIGGTNARFGLFDGTAVRRVRTLAGADHATLEAAVEAYLGAVSVAARPRRAALAVACPVTGDRVRLTNQIWEFSIEEARRRLALDRLEVLNDFEALALALPLLDATGTRSIREGTPEPGEPLALLGPGTGLGVGGLIPVQGRWVPLATEGGHRDLAAADDREWEIVRAVSRRYGHVSVERVLSGPGLVNIYRALMDLDGETGEDPAPAVIVRRAAGAAGADAGRAREAVRLFSAWLGAVAGDLALTLGARGGVFLGGGMLPKMGPVFDDAAFVRRFLDKGRFRAYLEPVPIRVIVERQAALRGAAQALTEAVASGP